MEKLLLKVSGLYGLELKLVRKVESGFLSENYILEGGDIKYFLKDILLKGLCDLARPQSPSGITIWQGRANRKRSGNIGGNWQESRGNDPPKYDTLLMKRRHAR